MANKALTLKNERPNNNPIKLIWQQVNIGSVNPYYEVKVPALENKFLGHYSLVAEQRPPYCDRGRWSIKIFSVGVFDLDGQEDFPRYFFKLENLMEEVEAWVNKRESCIKAYERNKTLATVPASK